MAVAAVASSAAIVVPGAFAGGGPGGHGPGGGGPPGHGGGGGGGDHGQPTYLNPRAPIPKRVADLVGRMTLAEKIGQMTQAERAELADDDAEITTLGLGSVLSGGGSVPTPNTPAAWADMVDNFQKAALSTRLKIPLLYGVDSVHGHGNLLGATVFPHNIGLGATRDPQLVRDVEHVTADETRASGPQWAFAPCICAAQDDRWGRTYESFSEDPDLVIKLETAIDGFQGNGKGDLAHRDRVLATAKHYAGDGDTVYGTGSGDYKIDQGVSQTSRGDFWDKALRQYVPAIRQHHAGSVMPSYSSVDWTEDGLGNPINMHGNKELITDVLKGSMKFDGLAISDYNGIDHIGGTFDENVVAGVNAGIDMFMQPQNYAQFITSLTAAVNDGRVAMSRIDDAVSRILAKKFELGLFEHPYTDRTDQDQIGSPQHRAVARRAVAESQVLLKNDDDALPIKGDAPIYVAGSNSDNIGNQAGGWTLTWQGGSTNVIPGTTILKGIQDAAGGTQVVSSPDASAPIPDGATGVVVVGETPYAEGFGDVGGPQWAYDPGDNNVPRPPQTMTLNDADKAAVDKVCAATTKCIVLVVSGRPLIIDPAQLDETDALVASWLPGSEGEGVADVLFGAKPFTGKLPMTWPKTIDQEPINVGDANYDPLFPYGFGLRTRGGHGGW
ncbi:glycoside hydrolase family 3 protein [Baekduia alba]|uniref:glycoside hydrolase family 3 protein n=1 Tax=Baekduia alba TaxID=2997333 RepID=UPI002341509F|nr:glycoside hydrolase family 3 protein [Baekduia alba]